MRAASIASILGIGVSWGLLWLAIMACIMGIIGIVDPDSIDPGEPQMFLLVFGPMGLLSGIAFALFLGEQRRTTLDVSLLRAILSGILGSAIVQVGYINHGDLGLAANIPMALAFSVFGGIVTAIWLFPARGWCRRRSFQSPRS